MRRTLRQEWWWVIRLTFKRWGEWAQAAREWRPSGRFSERFERRMGQPLPLVLWYTGAIFLAMLVGILVVKVL